MPHRLGVKRWLLLLAACGGGGSKHAAAPHRDPAAEAADAERAKLQAERPAKPYETRERVAFRPTERCGQGPYRMDTYSLRAHYGEQFVVYACGKHGIGGNYRLTTERKDRKPEVDDSAYGFDDADNAACKASRVTMSTAGTTGGGTSSGGGSPAKAGGRAAPLTTSTQSKTLEHVLSVPEECDQVRTQLLDMTYETSVDDVALDGHLVIELWSDEPNDFDGLYFVIEKRAVVANMTVERWKDYDRAYEEWHKRYRAFVDGEVASGRSHWVDDSVKTPPPPPARAEIQPPRPSTHARWIPGYWQYAEGSFHWLAGMWDVPDEDIAKDLTVHAPTPPPAPPVAVEHPQEARPTVTAVWTPGQWQWDGRAYIWIAGAWRIPPTQQHEWKPATWSVSTRGAIFVPGGWRINVRLK
jgi:hypothetical protein